MMLFLNRWEHSRVGSDWVDDLKCHPKEVLAPVDGDPPDHGEKAKSCQ